MTKASRGIPCDPYLYTAVSNMELDFISDELIKYTSIDSIYNLIINLNFDSLNICWESFCTICLVIIKYCFL